MKKTDIYKSALIGAISWIICQSGFSAFKEISDVGNVVQASYNAQKLPRTSIESPYTNVLAPQKSSDTWEKVIESSKYQSIGSTNQNSPVAIPSPQEVAQLREEVSNFRIELAQVKAELKAVQVNSLPGDQLLANNLRKK